MIIKNPKRFIIFILLSIVVLSQVFSLTGKAFEATVHNKLSGDKFLSNYEWIEWEVREGETYWKIQERLAPNSNISQLMHIVMKKNDKTVGEVYPGDKLIILKEKDSN